MNNEIAFNYNDLVEAPGIEPRDTSVRSVANSRDNDADRATPDDAKRREVSAPMRMSVDEAIGVAVKVAIDTGDLLRAGALLDLLEDSRRTTPVTLLPSRKLSR